ncbi:MULTISPECIES: fimbrial biogenesis chaperone [Silvimonas]|uniref:fimbrial biogenesis chaperone n=1 Tax=Silvimonas TaxID=300264 RepID=UPI0024B37B40|nr:MULTISPECIES: fimbria/pilus periplasmic chaperone [Silvimonas]MDR3427334.1 fimbria/pilus periplasmic chaperone [Silvimonas sp.]
MIKTKYALSMLLGSAALVLGLFAACEANASVVIGGTRVVYNAADHEETLKITNKGKLPALTQTWVDSGDAQVSPTNTAVPFTITPPVSRIDPDKMQTLRIFYTGEPLPQDKESVFWLNVLEIPPAPDSAKADQKTEQNYLQMAVHSRIKLFYRPKDLKGAADEAPAKVKWQLVKDGAGQALEAYNPTPYHVSLAGVEARSGKAHASFEEGGMIAPGATQRFALKGTITPTADASVHYRAINDFGGVAEGDAPFTTAFH